MLGESDVAGVLRRLGITTEGAALVLVADEWAAARHEEIKCRRALSAAEEALKEATRNRFEKDHQLEALVLRRSFGGC